MTRTVQRRGQTRKPAARAKRPPPPKLVALPVSPRNFYLRVAGAFAALSLVAALVVVTVMGLPQRWWQQSAVAAADAGFEVRHVEISGLHHLQRLPVYAAALDGATNSMLLVDLKESRARLRALPWVADASVGRRLPDTLIVDIVERRPVALWQFRQRVVAIDKTGAELTGDKLERFGQLPLVVGPGANRQAGAILARLDKHPALARNVEVALLVGGRRWDLRLKTGETMALPEGDAATERALVQFATLDRSRGLLAKGFTRFDLRTPDKLTLRGPGIRQALDAAAKAPKSDKIDFVT